MTVTVWPSRGKLSGGTEVVSWPCEGDARPPGQRLGDGRRVGADGARAAVGHEGHGAFGAYVQCEPAAADRGGARDGQIRALGAHAELAQRAFDGAGGRPHLAALPVEGEQDGPAVADDHLVAAGELGRRARGATMSCAPTANALVARAVPPRRRRRCAGCAVSPSTLSLTALSWTTKAEVPPARNATTRACGTSAAQRVRASPRARRRRAARRDPARPPPPAPGGAGAVRGPGNGAGAMRVSAMWASAVRVPSYLVPVVPRLAVPRFTVGVRRRVVVVAERLEAEGGRCRGARGPVTAAYGTVTALRIAHDAPQSGPPRPGWCGPGH